jgi:hypothetical protein
VNGFSFSVLTCFQFCSPLLFTVPPLVTCVFVRPTGSVNVREEIVYVELLVRSNL